jgi:hypothetical protein
MVAQERKKTGRQALLLLVATVAVPTGFCRAGEPDNWLCITDQAAGFSYDQGSHRWIAAIFKPENKKYVVRPTRPEDMDYQHDFNNGFNDSVPYKPTTKWSIAEIGDNFGFSCSGDFNEKGFLLCTTGLWDVMFGKNTLRFQIYYKFGYITGSSERDDNNDTPSVEIGRCTPI